MSELGNAAHRWEARVAIAMLPVGGTVLVVSAFALLLVGGLGVDVTIRQPAGWGWVAGWSTVAAGVALRNMRAGIAMMSAFDWRPLPLTLLLSALVAVGWLALP